MQNNLNIRGEPIQIVYSSFKKGQYIVNRRYQRKLVWSKSEKEKFIDSIINQYPVPLFLGVTFQDSKKGSCFEILDGMQRLEAITSFIEGRFPVNGKYFDLGVISETSILRDKGKLEQKSPKLDRDTCATLLNYPIPISTTTYSSSEDVDETFRRINTGGVRLSKHEVRQAGSIGDFSQLVRKCATYVRGDVSHRDIVNLQTMHEISLTYDDLDYGVKLKDTFWNKYHILGNENILASRDEELIAHTISTILFGVDSPPTSTHLDRLYSSDHKEYSDANDAVLKNGSDFLYRSFCFTYDELKKCFDEGEINLAKHLYSNEPKRINRAYQVIFLAVHEFLTKENKKIKSYSALSKALRNIASSHMSDLFRDKQLTARNRTQMVKAVKGVIEESFVSTGDLDPATRSWTENFETILQQSRTENVCYDFKTGLLPLRRDAGKNDASFEKIIKTLTAMHNSYASSVYVLLGVADREITAKKHKEVYSIPYLEKYGFFITGVTGEAQAKFKDIDGYQQYIHQKIQASPITEEAKRNIQRNTLVMKYYNHDVVVMKMDRMDKPAYYNDKIYVRKMANNEPDPISNDKLFEFFNEFKKQGEQYPYS
ncbi:DUF262 domain-containing protein [Cobetia amphilecti]|uniref:DUF262 domain-containing protein n=1 Tax=Cobetia amphilecti TaxID=1055104 RepID=UPI0026E1A763|nr:DUF262 domain-containing protein [Cobetia amphilecti]MDO6815973.1 DUF262 domain-containing protein [Cobetia amphilecti]